MLQPLLISSLQDCTLAGNWLWTVSLPVPNLTPHWHFHGLHYSSFTKTGITNHQFPLIHLTTFLFQCPASLVLYVHTSFTSLIRTRNCWYSLQCGVNKIWQRFQINGKQLLCRRKYYTESRNKSEYNTHLDGYRTGYPTYYTEWHCGKVG
jgi:hypothetical protein